VIILFARKEHRDAFVVKIEKLVSYFTSKHEGRRFYSWWVKTGRLLQFPDEFPTETGPKKPGNSMRDFNYLNSIAIIKLFLFRFLPRNSFSIVKRLVLCQLPLLQGRTEELGSKA
jgi:hypothetical protein